MFTLKKAYRVSAYLLASNPYSAHQFWLGRKHAPRHSSLNTEPDIVTFGLFVLIFHLGGITMLKTESEQHSMPKGKNSS
jgi:hypothetical protein